MSNIHTSIYGYMRAYRDKGDTAAVIRGRRKMSFLRFFGEIDRVAAGLYSLGVRRGDVVMLALPSIEQEVVAAYAVSKLGGIASFIHPKISIDEFKREFDLQNPKVVFISDINQRAFGKIAKSAKRVYCPYGVYAYFGLPSGEAFEEFEGDGEDAALYMHSGGTSGVPKTVVLSARAVNAVARNLLSSLGDNFNESDTMLAALPLFHGYGFCVGVHASLCTNMPTVLLPKFSGQRAAKAVIKNKVTTMVAVPRMLKKLLCTDGFCGRSIYSLKNVYVGGDALDLRLEDDFNLRLNGSGSEAFVSPGYGLTETGSVCAVSRGTFKKGSSGKLLEGMKGRIVGESGEDVAKGETGELLLWGEQLMSGYLKDPEATESAFVNENGIKWLKTGDLFCADSDGNLFFKGRKKRLIKIAGMNVFPSEIERVAKELSFIGECAATEFCVKGKSYIKLSVEGRLSEAQKNETVKHIGRSLSHWHTPRIIECIEALPRTAVGKIDYRKLSEGKG